MIPQSWQTKRGRVSPAGTRCSTRAPQALQKFIGMAIGSVQQSLYKRVQPCPWRIFHDAPQLRRAVRMTHGSTRADPTGGGHMNSKTFIAIAMAMFFSCSAADDSGRLAGSWKGPWYIGMSSGIAVMDLAADGSGTIALTNLEEFGAQPVPLTKQSFDGKRFNFSAIGTNGAPLVMNLQLGEGGKQLRGNGKHAGFGARMELQRAD